MYRPLNFDNQEREIFERPFAKPKPNPVSQAINSMQDGRYERYECEGWWSKGAKNADEDPLAQIPTGLPSNLKELASGLDPTTLNRLITATVVIAKSLKFVKDLGKDLYQKYTAPENGGYASSDMPDFSGYEPLGNIMSASYPVGSTNAASTYTDAEFRVLRDLVEYFIKAQAPDVDLNDPGIVDDETASMLMTLGSLGIDNDQLARLKFFPKERLTQITALLKSHDKWTQKQKSMFTPFENIEDIYTKQKMGSFEDETKKD